MTTPRVTVPVEPEYTATDYLRLIAEGWEVIESTGSQMTIQNPEDDGPQDLVIDVDAILSAAPAPEGGAVPDDVRRLVIAARNVAFDTPTQSELRALDIASEAFASRVPWDDEPEALATREEAPAEAGEPAVIKGDGFNPQGGGFATLIVDGVRYTADQVRAALRAQPPAREDALPVALTKALEDLIDIVEGIGGIQHGTWRDEKGMRLKDTSAWAAFYVAARNSAHPAPDALRVAVEASTFLLDRLRDLEWDVNERDFNGHVLPAAARLRQALAILQAEQKGGA